MSKYTIILEHDPEAGCYSVTVPSLPGCTSQGDTIEEAIVNAREAIVGHIAVLRDIGEPVPQEIEHPQAVTIEVAG